MDESSASASRAAPPPLEPTEGLVRAILAIVGLYCALNVAHILILARLRAVLGADRPLSPLLEELDALQVYLPHVTTALYLAAGICFLFLVARLTRNLPALGSSHSLRPKEAVVNFLIPIANLVHGYTTVRTIWQESQPAIHPGLKRPSAPMLGWWWGSYLALAIFSRIAGKAAALPPGYTFDQWASSSYWVSAHCAVDALVGGLFMIVVYLLAQRQHAQHEDLTRRVPVSPRNDLLR